MPSGTFNLFGHAVKKSTVFIVGAGAAGVGGYMYYKHVKSANAATGTAATANTSAGTNAYGYGAATYGYAGGNYGYAGSDFYGYGLGPYNAAGDSDFYGYGAFGYGIYGADGQFLGQTGASASPTGTATATSNAEWTQSALAVLTGQGFSGETVLAALGLYLTGGTLTATQAQIVQSAIASEGDPPQSSASGFPPGIHTSSSTGTGTTPAAGQITIPNVKGLNVEQATSILGSAGLKASGPKGVKNASHIVTSTSPAIGTKVAKGTTVKLSYKTTKG